MEWLWLIPLLVVLLLIPFFVKGFIIGLREKSKPELTYNKRNYNRQKHYEWDLQYYQLCGRSVYFDIRNPRELNSLQEQWNKTFLSANELRDLARMERDNQLPT